MPFLGKDFAELIKVMIDMGSTLHNVSRKLIIGYRDAQYCIFAIINEILQLLFMNYDITT